MLKKILIISQCFYPEQFRINDIALEWVKRGYKVTVVTAIPNYPEGRFYPGYGLFKKRRENWNGIEIIRLPMISRGHSTLRLILNYYSFAVSGWFWAHLSTLKPDIIFSFETSPMTQALLGKWFSKRRKIPNYLYVQDLWPENLEVVGGIHNRFVINHYQRMTDRIYRSCKKILATSPSFVKAIQERVEDKEKVLYWPQYAEEFYQPAGRVIIPEIPDDDRFKVVFTGNIGIAQGLDILPKVAKLLDESICFVLVGDGRNKAKLLEEVKEEKEKFLFIDRQPAERIPELLAACDAAFLSFMDSPLFEKTIPAKLQSYMACGMPILASASGETKRIIEEANCGLCCELGDVEALAKGIKDLKESNLKKLGGNAKEYSCVHFDKTSLMNQIEVWFGEE